ncbi:hypothetical protein OS493_022540, partial [Desmophyllum pertusum]
MEEISSSLIAKLSEGEVLDLIDVGTVVSPAPAWTLVDVQSNDVDVHGILISASNKTNIASINVTMLNTSVEHLDGIFHGYIIFYKEVEEAIYNSERFVSAESSFLITGLKDWTLYSVYVRAVTLNGAGKRSDSILVWTKPSAPRNVTVYNVNNELHVQWENINATAVQQYRVHVSPAENDNETSCNVTAPADPAGYAVCGNLQAFVNYSVTVAGEGDFLGAYSDPVYFVIEQY